MPPSTQHFTPKIGSTLTDTIRDAIAYAAADREPDEELVVWFNWGDVTIHVKADSDRGLIFRDYVRASKGSIGKTVGPYPEPVLATENKKE